MAAQTAAEGGNPTPHTGLAFLVAFGPILLIIGLWVWYMRRIGVDKNREYMERTLKHFDRVAEQNERVISALERIEKQLRDPILKRSAPPERLP